MDSFAGMRSERGQVGGSNPAGVKEQERMEDRVDFRNNNYDTGVY